MRHLFISQRGAQVGKKMLAALAWNVKASDIADSHLLKRGRVECSFVAETWRRGSCLHYGRYYGYALQLPISTD